MRQDDGTKTVKASAEPGLADTGQEARVQALSSVREASGTFGAANDRATVSPEPSVRTTSFIYSGRHVGRLQVIGSGPRSHISVSYQGNELDAELGALPAIAVGEALLRRLVVQKAIAIKVQASLQRDPNNYFSRAS